MLGERLRIALVAPLYESVPPRLYGGTERVVANLANALVSMGHDVTLYASGDSQTAARLVATCPEALRLSRCVDPLSHHILQLERVFQRASEFDVIHFHNGTLHFPLARRSDVPTLTTMHGRLDLPDLFPMMREFTDMPLASISNAQRRPLRDLQWLGTVYNGMPRHAFRYSPRGGEHFVFLGRISPEKRVDRAIEIARRTGRRLIIAAKVDAADERYFATEIEPLLSHPLVRFIGEVNDEQKGALLRAARALLFPIDWPEPFGLVMIEAMACGAPVIAFNHGSVPEVIKDGVSGFIVHDMDGAVRAARAIEQIDRAQCRARFEQRFTSAVMADGYVALYRRLLAPRDSTARALRRQVAPRPARGQESPA